MALHRGHLTTAGQGSAPLRPPSGVVQMCCSSLIHRPRGGGTRAWGIIRRQPAEVAGQALRAAASTAATDSQPSCFHTILPEAEVSTNHG